MEIKKVFAFDHLPKGTTQATHVGGYGLNYGDQALKAAGSSSNYIYIHADGSLTCNGTSVAGYAIIRGVEVWLREPGMRSALGFRFIIPAGNSINRTTSTFLVTFQPTAGATANQQSIFTMVDIPDVDVGKEYYLELEFVDTGFGDITVRRRVDGVAISDYLISSGWAAWFRDGRAGIAIFPRSAVSTGNAGVSKVRDIYLSESGIEEQTAMLGPIKLKPITLMDVEAASWTTSDSSPIEDVLNSSIPSSGSTTIPNAISPIDELPIEASISAELEQEESIYGLQFLLSGGTDVPGAVDVKLELGLSGTEVDLGMVTLSSVWKYSALTPIRRLAPDGNAWTPGKIAGTSFKLTPFFGG